MEREGSGGAVGVLARGSVSFGCWTYMTERPLVPAGDPLQCGAWFGQCALYIVIMIFEKSIVFIVLLILQWKKVCLLSPL